MDRRPGIAFASYVDERITRYRKRVTAIAAVAASLAFGISILIVEIRTGNQVLHAVDAHIASLVETQDRPELQRLLKSITEEGKNSVLVVEDGIVVASSRTLSELDSPYNEPKSIRIANQSRLTASGLLTEIPILRPNGPKEVNAKIIILSPLDSLLFWSLGIALLILNVGLLMGSKLSDKLRKTIALALRPVKDLDEAIRSLKTLKDPRALKKTGIYELDHIADSILETHQALVNARDALAEKKAKELATEAYKRLIHDLHNPVSALRTMIKVSNLQNISPEERAASASRIPEVAEQILNQVSAAKSNLDFEAEVLKEEDIRDCIAKATEQARLASPRFETVAVESNFPELPVIFAHDANLLGRAVSNLVKNALDACRDQVRVVVQKGVGSTSIQVLDDGPGLPQDQVGLFLQGRARSTKEDRQAYGLAAANHIARIHGGRIIYKKSELGGACFEIRLHG